MSFLDRLICALSAAQPARRVGRVSAIDDRKISVTGLSCAAAIGDRVTLCASGQSCEARVVRVAEDRIVVTTRGNLRVSLGDTALLDGPDIVHPSRDMLGRVVDARGRSRDGRPLLPGPAVCPIRVDRTAAPNGDRAAIASGIPLVDLFTEIRTGGHYLLSAEGGIGVLPFVAKFAERSGFDAVIWVVGPDRPATKLLHRLGRIAEAKVVIVADEDAESAVLSGAAIAEYLAGVEGAIAVFDDTGENRGTDPRDVAAPGVAWFTVSRSDATSFMRSDLTQDSDGVIRLSVPAADAGLMPPVHPDPGHMPSDTNRVAAARAISDAIGSALVSELIDYFIRADGAWSVRAEDLPMAVATLLEASLTAVESPRIATGKEQPIP